MNSLKLFSKLSQLSFTGTRAITTSSNPHPHSSTSLGIGGEIRNTSSECYSGYPSYNTGTVGNTLSASEKGAGGGTSTGETIATRSTMLDTAVGVGGYQGEGRPYDAPTGLIESRNFGHHLDCGPGSGVGAGCKIITNEGLEEGPGSSKFFK